MRLPSYALVLASVAVAMAACGVDALGTMPSDASPTGSSTPAPSLPGEGDSAALPDAAEEIDAGDDALADASLDALPDAPITPLLELAHAPAPANVNLTTEGTLDWAYWGVEGSSTSVRKVGTSVISSLTLVYLSTGATASGFGTTFSWTDATSGTGSSDGYLWVVGNAGASETFTVPSGPVKRTVVVFVGGNEIRGKLTATLADGSLPAKTDTSYESQNDVFGAKYTIDFRTVAPSKLEVKWAIDTTYGTNSARFTAAALR